MKEERKKYSEVFKKTDTEIEVLMDIDVKGEVFKEGFIFKERLNGIDFSKYVYLDIAGKMKKGVFEITGFFAMEKRPRTY